MTLVISGEEVATKLEKQIPGSVIESSKGNLLVKREHLFDIVSFLKTTPGLDFTYLNHITAVDYFAYFELVYQFSSLEHNHSVVLKTRCYDRQNPVVSSIFSLHQGADFQEREIYDLMGISFAGHPNLKRILLWEGFEGHPLRKDYV
ncbi:MAG: NADH-quinone oxidoreductase subunit C [Chloroflexi bacterium]|nr:NADH-quinone oxidoreductase subunit C [Chloroflexota bacterium]